MSQKKMIETGQYWTAWQLVDGCTKVSPACQNCWAETMAKRFYKKELLAYGGVGEYNWQGKICLCNDNLDLPLRTKKNGKPLFPKSTVFSIWNDLFHKKVPFEFIDKTMAIIALCPQHTFLILTKRIETIQIYCRQSDIHRHLLDTTRAIAKGKGAKLMNDAAVICWPLPNLWFGITCENQQYADERIPTLLQIPAAQRFISLEPLLEKTWLGEYLYLPTQEINWVIVGAETSPKARYCPIENIESVVEQCQAASVSVWVKAVHIGTAEKFKIVHKFNELPEKVRIREFPRRAD
jgi:protein gp37